MCGVTRPRRYRDAGAGAPGDTWRRAERLRRDDGVLEQRLGLQPLDAYGPPQRSPGVCGCETSERLLTVRGSGLSVLSRCLCGGLCGFEI